MSNFDPNAILRGAQLTLVGAHRALQNPTLFTSEHYRQAALAVAAGIAIRLVISVPVLLVRAILWLLSFILNLDAATWDDEITNGLHFFEHSVLQIPFFLMSLMRYITPTLDRMFMDSLEWVDKTYVQKHTNDSPQNLRAMYYPNMIQYSTKTPQAPQKKPKEAIFSFFIRYGRKAGISLAVYLLSYLPIVGQFVLPAASFYTFNKAVGTKPALVIFGSALFLPRRYLIMFLQTYFSSRSLMRELLEPYFTRIHFSKEQKRKWFKDREGVLFGFGVGFFVLVKIPLVGVLIYGIAEASTAYLITKITNPPPPPTAVEDFPESQIQWKNKHEFLDLPWTHLDSLNISTSPSRPTKLTQELPTKKFT